MRRGPSEGRGQRGLTGFTAFGVVWTGQLLSLVGSGMTQFAIAVWAWETTGAVTALAVIGFFTYGATVALGPVAGALADRWDRKWVLVGSDSAAAAAAAAVLALEVTGSLDIWHLCVAGAVAGGAQAFQFAAYLAAITMLVPEEHYGRSGGMLSLADSAAKVAAPVLGGILMGTIGLTGILAIDLVTFAAAIAALAPVVIPASPRTEEGREAGASLGSGSLFGFRYIWKRKGFLGLQTVFTLVNFLAASALVLLQPLVLARTGDDARVLGLVLSASGVGGVVGGLVMSGWGGPRRRVHGVLGGMALFSLTGLCVLGLGRTPAAWITGMFLLGFWLPVINGSNQAIWQAEVEPDVQGRVFAARRVIAQIAAPLGMLAVGPLADEVVQPLLSAGGSVARLARPLVGTGEGSGMSLLMLVSGLVGTAVALGAYLSPAVRAMGAPSPPAGKPDGDLEPAALEVD